MAIICGKPTVDQPLGTTVTTTEPAVLKTPNKANIQDRLNKALNNREPRNRSSDLIPLTQDYEFLRKKLLKLIEAANDYHDSFGRMSNARIDSMEVLNKILKDTPLESVATSDMNIQNQLADKNREMSKRYKREIIDYLVQLENAISTRVETEKSQVHELHARLLHYEKKIEKLRATVGSTASKSNSEAPQRKVEKLQRNEEKLNRAWKLHEAKASRICDLLEEVTVNGWKDLYNVVGNIFEFEKDYNEENAKFNSELSTLKMQLDEIYYEHRDKSYEGSVREIPIALKTEEAKNGIVKNEVRYNDDIPIEVSAQNIPLAPETEKTKMGTFENEVHYDDEVSLSSSSSFDSSSNSLPNSTSLGAHDKIDATTGENKKSSFFGFKLLS